jgi:CHAT domain-containing protein
MMTFACSHCLAGFALVLLLSACQTSPTQQQPKQAVSRPAAAVTMTANDAAANAVEAVLALNRADRDDEALALAQRHLAEGEARWGAGSLELAADLNTLAEQYRRRAEHALAEPYYQRLIALLEAAGPAEEASLAVAYANLGVNYRQAGNYVQAQRYLRDSLQLRQRLLPAGDPGLAMSYANLGALALQRGRFDEAEHDLGKAAQGLQAAPAYRASYLAVLGNLAALYRRSGDYDKAELYFKRLLEAAPSTASGTRRERIAALNGLGDLYRLLSDLERAEAVLQEALSLSNDTATDAALKAETLNNLAVLYQQSCRYPPAQQALQTSLTLLAGRYGLGHEKTLAVKQNLGLAQYRAGRLDDARSTLQTVLASHQRHRHNPLTMASTLNALAGVEWARGESASVRELLDDAIRLRRAWLPDPHPDLATSLGNLAIYHAGIGQSGQSLALFEQANAMDGGVLEYIAGFASEEQKRRYLGQKSRHLFAYLSLVTDTMQRHPQSVRAALDIWLQRKGMLLEIQRRYREALVYRDASDAVLLMQDLAQKRAELMAALSTGEMPRSDADSARLSQLESAIDALENRLTVVSPSYAEQVTLARATADLVASRLPAQSVLVEFVKFDRFAFAERDPRARWQDSEYWAFLLFPDGETRLIELGDARRLDQAIADLQLGIAQDLEAYGQYSTDLRQAEKPAHALYKRVFAPLERVFRPGTKTVFIAPDGQFNVIPFEILINDNQRFLVQDYRFAYLSSGRDLLRKPLSASATGASKGLIVGAPTYDLDPKQRTAVLTRLGLTQTRGVVRRLPRDLDAAGLHFLPLDSTLIEARRIAKVLGQEKVGVYTQQNAVEDLFYQLQQPRFLHVATHGFFLPDQSPAPANACAARQRSNLAGNPLLRAGLAFTGANYAMSSGINAQDGILTAEEVLGLDLRQTELVVLSACETGLGEVLDGEGVYGLRRAFVAAGAGGLVMSLWSVADEETADLMVALYQAMQKPGQSPGEAMHQAQLQMIDATRKNYGYPPLLLWGAFIYQGGAVNAATVGDAR